MVRAILGWASVVSYAILAGLLAAAAGALVGYLIDGGSLAQPLGTITGTLTLIYVIGMELWDRHNSSAA